MAETQEDEYDAQHGKPGADHQPVAPNEQWGETQNPVRNDPLPARNLKQMGG